MILLEDIDSAAFVKLGDLVLQLRDAMFLRIDALLQEFHSSIQVCCLLTDFPTPFGEAAAQEKTQQSQKKHAANRLSHSKDPPCRNKNWTSAKWTLGLLWEGKITKRFFLPNL
jgi:hypothetical protein